MRAVVTPDDGLERQKRISRRLLGGGRVAIELSEDKVLLMEYSQITSICLFICFIKKIKIRVQGLLR